MYIYIYYEERFDHKPLPGVPVAPPLPSPPLPSPLPIHQPQKIPLTKKIPFICLLFFVPILFTYRLGTFRNYLQVYLSIYLSMRVGGGEGKRGCFLGWGKILAM
jgi:hypothetical protein